jgi:anthranilate phosphoribosyltransferase
MKHGNRSNSSKCGSADLLEACGANLEVEGAQAIEVLEKTNFCFIFANKFHPLMKNVAAARRELGVRSIFNILGPLSNPCRPVYQMSGVFRKDLCPLYAEVFKAIGLKKAMVCISEQGLDEISPEGTTHCWWVQNGEITQQDITPEDFGLPEHALSEVAGGDPEDNKKIFEDLLEGKDLDSPIAHYVLENAAAALVVAEMAEDFKDGVAQCRAAISSGKAKTVLDEYVSLTAAFKIPSEAKTVKKATKRNAKDLSPATSTRKTKAARIEGATHKESIASPRKSGRVRKPKTITDASE